MTKYDISLSEKCHTNTYIFSLTVLPTSVKISYKKPDKEGSRVELICITQGSRPAADISWSIRGLPISEKPQVGIINYHSICGRAQHSKYICMTTILWCSL